MVNEEGLGGFFFIEKSGCLVYDELCKTDIQKEGLE